MMQKPAMIEKTFYVFDFDGVLIDSVDEVVVSAYNTVAGTDFRRLGDLPSGFRELFRLNRCRGRKAGQMVVLAEWCRANCETRPDYLMTPAEADAIFKPRDREVAGLGESFFAERRRFVRDDRPTWLSLNAPYRPLWESLQNGLVLDFAILTYKNRDAVLDICAHHGLPLAAEQVFSGDHGQSKHKNFETLIESFPAESYLFVDDSVENLLEVKGSLDGRKPLDLYFASWGYAAPEEFGLAQSHGIPSVTQEEFLERVSHA